MFYNMLSKCASLKYLYISGYISENTFSEVPERTQESINNFVLCKGLHKIVLEDIFVYLVNNASNLISITSIVNYFKSLGRKVSYDAVSNYIGHIEDTFLVHRCKRYNIKEKEILSGNSKFYINDLAYKNYLYSGFGSGFGYLAENLVYFELRRAGFDVNAGTLRNKEVDFVAKKDDRIIYLQSS